MYKTLNPNMVNMKTNFSKTVELAAKNGFGAVEFNPQLIEEELGVERAIDKMGREGVILSNFGLPVNVRGSDDDFSSTFAGLEKMARLARDFGCHRSATYILGWHDELEFAECFRMHTRRLRLCAEVLREYGISLGLEFLGPRIPREKHKYPFIYTLAGMLELCDAVGTGNMGIMLDAHHCHTAGMAADEFAKVVRSQKDLVVVHLNDAAKGDPDTLPDSPRYLAGESGGIDCKKFLTALDGIGYTGPVIAEPFSDKLKAMDDPEAICKLVAASFDAVWPA